MKTIITLLFLSSTAFAGKAPAPTHPTDPLPPKCSQPFKIDLHTPAGFTGFCCSTNLTFVMKPEQNCPSGYQFMSKPKPPGTTYYYCCQMNVNPNGNHPNHAAQ